MRILEFTLAACDGGKTLCVRPGLCVGFGVHTALINLHLSGSRTVSHVAMGNRARLETNDYVTNLLDYINF